MTISQGPSALAPEVQDSAPGVPSRVQNHFSQRSFTQPNVVPKQNFAVSNDPSNVRVGMGPGLSKSSPRRAITPQGVCGHWRFFGAVFAIDMSSPQGVLFPKSPPEFDAEGSEDLFEPSNPKTPLRRRETNLFPSNPGRLLLLIGGTPKEASQLLFKTVQGSLCGLNGLEKVNWNRFKRAPNESQPPTEG